MLTFSWTGKRKKKSETNDPNEHIDARVDYNSGEQSVSRSTTSTGSFHFGQISSYTSADTNFKDAEYSGRLCLSEMLLSEFPIELLSNNNEVLDVVFIDLSKNQLSTLPADFSLFDCLISFVASSNRFTKIPSCICSLEQLTFLDFSSNEISILPDGLFDLPLVNLLLANNKITKLPDSIRRLAPTLAYLDLSNNKLKHLESHLKYLKKLKVLNVSKNAIDEFPAEFCEALQLRTLKLANNNLTHLSNNLLKMKELKNIQLECNPMIYPPIKIVERGIIHIFKWLQEHNECNYETNKNVEKQKMEASTRNSVSPEKSSRVSMLAPTQPQLHQKTKASNNNNNNITTTSTMGNDNKLHNQNADVQNNNHNKKGILVTTGNKPISKVAPLVKGSTLNSSAIQASRLNLTKTNIVQKPAPKNVNVIKMGVTKKNVAPTAGTALKKLRDETEKMGNKKIGLKKNIELGTVSDVENARKVMREKLGSTFSLGKGDLSFSQQLSDGLELCKFVNKLHPMSIQIASTNESAINSTRARINVNRFVQYCKNAGVPESVRCSALDILTKKNADKIAKTVLFIHKMK